MGGYCYDLDYIPLYLYAHTFPFLALAINSVLYLLLTTCLFPTLSPEARLSFLVQPSSTPLQF
jgi:hypothetical protein